MNMTEYWENVRESFMRSSQIVCLVEWKSINIFVLLGQLTLFIVSDLHE